MAATARKSIKNDDLKRLLPVKESINFTKQLEDNVHQFERSSVESANAVVASCTHVAEQWSGACSQGFHTCLANSEKSLANMVEATQSVVEAYHKIAADLMQLSKDALDCRSFDEFYNLQRKTASLVMNDWMQELGHLNHHIAYCYGPVCVLPPD